MLTLFFFSFFWFPLFFWQNNKYVRGFGGPANVKAFYKDLPEQAKKLVKDAGFGEFVELLDETSSDHVQMTALIERWWDTTNTLHFPFGEATLTPLDFAAITGIRVGGDRIPFDMDLYKNSKDLAHLLGRVPDDISGSGTVRYRWFYEQFQEDMKSGRSFVTETDFEQLARAFLLYLFGATLFPSKDSRVHLHYLAAMRDFATVKDYNWGGAALATLYGHMGIASRSSNPGVGGYWRVWEVTSHCCLSLLLFFVFTNLLSRILLELLS